MLAIDESNPAPMVCRYTLDGTLLYSNDAFDRLLGDQGSQYILDFMPFVSTERDNPFPAWGEQAENKPLLFHVEHTVMLADEREHWLRWTIKEIPEGANDVAAFEATGYDITERKKLEQQERILYLEKEKSRLLREFVTNLSHDFRTPLSVINTSLYLLSKSDDPQRAAHHRHAIEEQVDRLAKLVEDLLTITALDSEIELRYELIDLNALVHDVLAVHRIVAEEKGLMIVQELQLSPPFVHADKVSMGQALIRVLENAIQYTPAGGTITLRTRWDGIHAIIEVEDTGIGISETELSRVFGRLYKISPARRTSEGGIGLGLPIANAIVEKHGGRIDIESTVGKGSIFRLCIRSDTFGA